MQRSMKTTVAALALFATSVAWAQTPASPGTSDAKGKAGVNVGSLTCKVSGGMGFIFGSTKALDCLFARTDGIAEQYSGTVNKYGIDIGFTKPVHVVWHVYSLAETAPPGVLSGQFAGSQQSVAVGATAGGNALYGGSSNSIIRRYSLSP